MNNTQAKTRITNTAKTSKENASGGEAPQKQGVKGKKAKKINPETVAARKQLIAMSQKAQDMMELAENGAEIDGFEECEKVNDYLLVMHQQATGCETFKTFADWKKAGFKVKKGSKAYRVWGSPLKAKKQGEEQQAETTTDDKKDAEKTFQYWPMCCLFNENQVEPIEGNPEPTEPEPGNKTEKVETEAANNQASQYTQDMGNNESLKRGLFPQTDGGFLAMTFTESKPFKTRTGAERWLAARGLDASGRYIEDEAQEEDKTIDPSPFVTVDYQEQQEARKDRMLERADKASAEFQATYNRAKDMASVIPFGQPILVGHHSEKRDRRYRDKIHNTFGKAFELDSKADHYREKAEKVGKGGIASNDPEAIEKLKTKLAELEAAQETMKAVNKIIRSAKLSESEKIAEIVAAELLTEAGAAKILKPDYCGRVGVASFELTNNSAEIRRIKQRISTLEKVRNSDPIEFENDDFSMAIENGRVCVEFSGGKPSDEVRAMLRGAAFKWSRYQGAWVRKATANALAVSARLLDNLKKVESIY